MALSTGLVEISDEDRATLSSWSRSTSIPAGLVTRAKIVLAAADGEGTSAISRRLGVSRPTVIQWRNRSASAGLPGLADAEGSGRPKTVDDAAVSRFIDGWNDRCHPFTWTKTADDIQPTLNVNQLQTRDTGAGL